MNDFAGFSATASPRISSRSIGVKLIVICVLAILMNIPGLFVQGLVDSRMSSTPGPAPAATWNLTVDSYRSVDRSLKYILLFEGLVFLSYFAFEVTSGKRMHPAQYVLVGVAQVIFYLLLLSLAEKIGFDLGFLIAGAATVSLLSMNAAWVFASSRHGYRALSIFAPLYALIYVLLRMKEYALLVGAVTSFSAVAIVMFLTRNVDWYGTGPVAQSGSASAGDPKSWHLSE